jgi:hypothetical protein
MSFARTDGNARPAGATPWRRWAVVGLLSLFLHLLALNWVNDNFRLPGAVDEAPPVVLHTTLIQAAQPPQPASRPKPIPAVARAAKPPQPQPRLRPQPPAPARPPAAEPAPVTAAVTAVAETPPLLSSPASDAANFAQSAMPSASVTADDGYSVPDFAAIETAAATPSAPATENSSYKIDPPPSATLEYAVQALRESQMVYGHGKIAWKLDGNRYAINGEAGILFIALLDFGSHGLIDESGIAPVLYTEKRFRRAQTETRFDRQSKLISFSASAKSFPIQGGEQDRASIIWQLASIGRGDAARFVPGAQIPLFIAGVRDGSTWNIQVLGEEDIQVGLGGVRAWHVRRAPRAGDKDQILDIWLAPSHHWYPVKLRYTETNGEYLELSLSGIEAPAS